MCVAHRKGLEKQSRSGEDQSEKKKKEKKRVRPSGQIVDLEDDFQHIAVRNCSSGYDTSIFN